MSEIKDWFFVKQLKCDNKKFISIIPKFTKKQHSNQHKHNGNLLMYCVTNDDNVYVYECIDGQYIGDVNKNSMSEPKMVEELCEKQVIDIKCGIKFTMALTKTGHIYSWGWNQFGQLGRGKHYAYKSEYNMRPIIIPSLMNKCVVDIICGAFHCVALTRNGEVFEWGWNGGEEVLTIPRHVFDLQYETIISIACGLTHTLVLTDNGDVFSWGMNSKGQLGIGSYNFYQRIPIKIVNLNGDKIIKICCAENKSMLLSENGDIYMFGGTKCDKNIQNIPFKMIVSTKFVDICASFNYFYSIFTGLSEDGFFYVWGEKEWLIPKLFKNGFKNIDEAILKYSNVKMTCKAYYFMKTYENMSPLERIRETFNKSEFRLNDILFKIDGKYIYAQKSYLISVCQHFDTLFSNEWIESTNNEIEITQYSYQVYYSFLKYLYTNSVDIQSKHLIELYYLSDSYFEENLKKKCIEIMKEVINVNNAINFYAFFVKNNYEEMEKYTFDFMKVRVKDVIKTEAYQLKDISIQKRLFETILYN